MGTVKTVDIHEAKTHFSRLVDRGKSYCAAGVRKQQYAVAADGQQFLMNIVVDATVAPITIVQNWTAGLKK